MDHNLNSLHESMLLFIELLFSFLTVRSNATPDCLQFCRPCVAKAASLSHTHFSLYHSPNTEPFHAYMLCPSHSDGSILSLSHFQHSYWRKRLFICLSCCFCSHWIIKQQDSGGGLCCHWPHLCLLAFVLIVVQLITCRHKQWRSWEHQWIWDLLCDGFKWLNVSIKGLFFCKLELMEVHLSS